MRTVMMALVLLWGSAVGAQTLSTSVAGVDGTSNCRAVNVNVNQTVQNGGSTTTLFYRLRDTCANQTLFEGYGPIAGSAYKAQQTTHALSVQTKDGPIQLTWRATNTQQQTFTSTATEKANGTIVRRVQEDQFFSSASAEGTVLGTAVSAGDRPATISQITQTTR
jgi:hypothetical protein